MPKYTSVLREDTVVRRPKSKVPVFLLLAIALIAALPAYEGGQILYAQWQPLIGGPSYEPRTPVLDRIVEIYHQARDESRYQIAPLFHTGSWRPSIVVPIVVTIAGLAVLALRKGH
jgi:hypothetical protein